MYIECMKATTHDSDARERLIKAAQALLWERGFMGTSPAAIQQMAEVGQGSMYHHFKSKEGLALAAIERSANERWGDYETLFAAESTAYGRIAAYLHAERDVLRGCRIGRLTQDPDIMGNEALRAPVDALFTRLKTQLADFVAQGQAQGEVDTALDPLSIAEMVVAVVQGGYVIAKAANDTQPFARAMAGVLSLLGTHMKCAP